MTDYNEKDIYKENLSVNKSFAAIMPVDPYSLKYSLILRKKYKQAHLKCPQCQSDDPMTPTHNGSRFCECGSISAGGTKSHCTCDYCY
jgi:hypothetical protein